MSISRAISEIERNARGQLDGVKKDFELILFTTSGLRWRGRLGRHASSDGFLELEQSGEITMFDLDKIEAVRPVWLT